MLVTSGQPTPMSMAAFQHRGYPVIHQQPQWPGTSPAGTSSSVSSVSSTAATPSASGSVGSARTPSIATSTTSTPTTPSPSAKTPAEISTESSTPTQSSVRGALCRLPSYGTSIDSPNTSPYESQSLEGTGPHPHLHSQGFLYVGNHSAAAAGVDSNMVLHASQQPLQQQHPPQQQHLPRHPHPPQQQQQQPQSQLPLQQPQQPQPHPQMLAHQPQSQPQQPEHPPHLHHQQPHPYLQQQSIALASAGPSTSLSAAAAGPAAHSSGYSDDAAFDVSAFGASQVGVDDGRHIEVDQDEVDDLIRKTRKMRDPKACYACHHRKVKCNRKLPCDACVKRDHPELCSYGRPTKRRRIALPARFFKGARGPDDGSVVTPSTSPNICVPREQWERMNEELKQLREQQHHMVSSPETVTTAPASASATGPIPGGDGLHELYLHNTDDPKPEGILAPSDQMGSMHLGSRSLVAYMLSVTSSGQSGQEMPAAQSLLQENILSKLGLDNESVTYPFVDLWSTDNPVGDVQSLCNALPDTDLCNRFFESYRDLAWTLFPVIPEPARFKETFDQMLANRAKAGADSPEFDPNKPFGITLPFLALVFAVLASGSQCSHLSAKQRELTSQVYTCCYYQALRLSNFMTHPCLETVQASLIACNVLANNMNPGVAYIFLGLVTRMAFTIGLHMTVDYMSKHAVWQRRRVWWALAWMDSHLSICYDRPTATAMVVPDIPYEEGSRPGNRSYAETMYGIIQLTQGIIRYRALYPRASMSWSRMQKFRDRIIEIVSEGAPFLRDPALCVNKIQRVQRLGLTVHISYIISDICRPALAEHLDEPLPPSCTRPLLKPTSIAIDTISSNGSDDGASISSKLRGDCIANLERAVAAFVELYNESGFAAHNWVAVQRSVSAAFLLGTTPLVNREPRVLQLLRSFENCIRQRLTQEFPPEEFGQQTADNAGVQGSARTLAASYTNQGPHWANSMVKSLNALGKLNAALNDNSMTNDYTMITSDSSNGDMNHFQIIYQQHQPFHSAGVKSATASPQTNSGIHFPNQQISPSGHDPAKQYSPNMEFASTGMAAPGSAVTGTGPGNAIHNTGNNNHAPNEWTYANLAADGRNSAPDYSMNSMNSIWGQE